MCKSHDCAVLMRIYFLTKRGIYGLYFVIATGFVDEKTLSFVFMTTEVHGCSGCGHGNM